MKVDLGTLPDWFSGIGGTAAAFVVAATYFWDRRRTADDRHTAIQRDRRLQAEGITYFLERGREAYPTEGETSKVPDGRSPKDAGWFHYHEALDHDWGYLVVVNNSHSCAYGTIANVPDGAVDGSTRGIGVIPRGITRINMPMRQYPGEGSGAWTRHDGEFVNNELVPWIEFRDQAGVAWRRCGDGALNEVAEPVPFPDYSV